MELPTIKIRGKDYVMVKDRVKWLSENHRYSVATSEEYIRELNAWFVKADLEIYFENKVCTYHGVALEYISDNPKSVNHQSALENAATSAIGRACAAAGIGIQSSYASAEELRKSRDVEGNDLPF